MLLEFANKINCFFFSVVSERSIYLLSTSFVIDLIKLPVFSLICNKSFFSSPIERISELCSSVAAPTPSFFNASSIFLNKSVNLGGGNVLSSPFHNAHSFEFFFLSQ